MLISEGLYPRAYIRGHISQGLIYPVTGGLISGGLITGGLISGRLISGAFIWGLYPGGLLSRGIRSTLTILKSVFRARSGRTHLLQINDNHLFHKLLYFFVDVVLKVNTT